MVKENRAKREQDRLEEDKMAEEAKKKKEELLRLLGAKPKTPIKQGDGLGTGSAPGAGAGTEEPPSEGQVAETAQEARRHKKEYLKMLGAYVKDDDQV
jgi:hypothetical protein